MNSKAIIFDPARRQILPAALAVKAPRFAFTDEHAQRAAILREVEDCRTLDWVRPRAPLTPRPEPADTMHESIVMSGAEIQRTMRTGSHEVRQRYTAALADDAPLSIVDDAPAFEPAPSIQAEASKALDRLAAQRTRARRAARPAPAPSVSPWPYIVGAAVLVAMFTTAWCVLS